VDFSDDEIEHNVPFDELVLLFDRDGGLDFFKHQFGSEQLSVAAKDNRDDAIGEIFNGSGMLRPDGNMTVNRVHRREWPFPRNEDGREQYRALVLVRPLLRQVTRWSNEVSANLR
jgi:hypothetical protein